MRIGLIGPATIDEVGLLQEAAEFLVGDLAVDQALFLGDTTLIDQVAKLWARAITSGDERSFVERTAELAVSGTPEQIDALLEAEQNLAKLSILRALPPSPARAVEMVDDRIIIAVHDKKVLDEDDIANASVIVYGRSSEILLKQFGPRYFFTPGPLAGGKVGVIELEQDGNIVVAAYEPSGMPIWREVLQSRGGSKVTVS